MLTALIEEKQHTDWLKRFNQYTKEEVELVINKEMHPDAAEMTMAEVIDSLNELYPGRSGYCNRCWPAPDDRLPLCKVCTVKSNVTSGGLGTMGFALPAPSAPNMEHRIEQWLQLLAMVVSR